MDRGTCGVMVHGVAKNQTGLKRLSTLTGEIGSQVPPGN